LRIEDAVKDNQKPICPSAHAVFMMLMEKTGTINTRSDTLVLLILEIEAISSFVTNRTGTDFFSPTPHVGNQLLFPCYPDFALRLPGAVPGRHH
jgi:hypothetical protein